MTPFTFAWPTAGNRSCLIESIQGFARHAAEYGHTPRVLVSVDAPLEGDMARRVSELLGEIESRYGFQTELFTLDRREKLYTLLRDICPAHLLEYALLRPADGPGWGCNVNASMLLSAGRFLLSTDDDIECLPAVPRGTTLSGTVREHDGSTPSLMLYYADRQALLSAVTPVEADVTAAYRALLGKTAGELLPEAPDNFAAGDKVYMVSPGTYGDTAMGSSLNVVILEDESRRHLHNAGYEEMRLSRNMVRISSAPTITKGLTFLATQFAADNRVPLPPFMTFGRNIDGAANTTLRILYGNSLNAHLGFGLYHNPPTERLATIADLTEPRRALSEILKALLIGSMPPAQINGIEDRYGYIGERLQAMAALSAHEFVDLVHEAIAHLHQPMYLNMLDLQEAYAGECAVWDADMEKLIERMEETLREPMSLFGESGCGLSPDRAKWHLHMYGGLLSVWPKLHRRCMENN